MTATRTRLPLGMLWWAAIGCGEGGQALRPLGGPATAATGSQSADAALAVDPDNGDALLTWVGGDSTGWYIYFSRSPDRGATWSAPVRVNDRAQDVTPHGEASPRLVAARRGVVAVAWPHGFPVAGRKWGATHMRFARSTDGGQTWAPTITLNDDSTGAPGSHTFHGAAWEGERDFVVAWLDERSSEAHHGAAHAASHDASEEGDATIYLARSRDLGATWDKINEAKWPTACPCCRVALARGPDGGVVASWRKHFPGDVRDVVAGPLQGNDASQLRVHADEWVFPGCPHTGPSLAVDGRGRTHVAWYTGKPQATGIRYALSAAGTAGGFEPATFLSRGPIPTAHVAVAGLPGGGGVVAYDRDPGGAARLGVSIVGPDGVARAPLVLAASRGADHPAIAALNDSVALVAWTQQSDAGSRVALAAVRLAPR